MELLLASGNAHKLREFAELLGAEFGIRPANVSEIEETGRSFAENAILKALYGSQDRDDLVMADDSGLEVDALNGAPGIFSARYAGESATDQQNIEKLLRELKARNISPDEWAARFRCVIALAGGGKLITTFTGKIDGKIIEPARGKNGFGYDPIFVPLGFEKTFAELPASTKNEISHRAKAANALREFLRRKQSPRKS